MTRDVVIVTVLLGLALAGTASGDLTAQSVTTGVVAGTVVGTEGGALPRVQVTARRMQGGLPRIVMTDGQGRFLVEFLEPGDYELLVERLGYHPVVVAHVPVLAARRLDVRVQLADAPGPVAAPDTVLFRGHGVAGGSRPGRDRTLGEWEVRSVPGREADLADAARFSSTGGPGLESEGLPAALGRAVIAGIPFSSAHHAALPGAGLETLAFPLRALGGIEVMAGRPDVEWPGAAGGVLAATPRPPFAAPGAEADAVWGGLAVEDLAGGGASWRLGGRAGSPMAGDSAFAWVVAEAQDGPGAVGRWPTGADDLLASLAGAGVDVEGLDRVTEGSTRRLNLGGAFDWHFPGGLALDAIALYGQAEMDHLPASIGPLRQPAAGEARDLLAAVTATTPVGDQLALQLRGGYTHSSRDFAADPAPTTGLGDAAVFFAPEGLRLGGDPALPALHERGAITVQGTAHYRSGPHHVKVGAGGEFTSHDRTTDFGRGGLFMFGDAAAYTARTGVFRGAVGTLTPASFSTTTLFTYAQNSWRVAPGLDVTTGLRYERESLPAGDLVLNRRWLELTGMDNTAIPGSTSDVGVVAGFDWDLQELHEWRVRGGLAVHRGEVSPDALAEALTHDGRIRGRAAVGDVTAPLDMGPRLTLLAPDLRSPLTTRASLGVSRALGAAAAVHLGLAFRQTDNLPVRAELNLPIQAPFQDQYGRPVHGDLVRVGPLLAAEPGTNRRFTEFDAVSAIASTASSTYWGVTAGIEQQLGWARIGGSYTFSGTEDDWPGAAQLGAIGAPHPFPGHEALAGWTRGTSDFDVPHRLSLAAEATLPFAPLVTLGGFLHRASGRPFTPGFGPGVDANADGWAGHDPVYVDDAIAGMDDMLARWDCLRGSVGRFVDRNACRLPDRSLLDAWVAVRLAVGGMAGELRVEALGLAADGAGVYDTVLLQVDPQRELVTNTGAGRVTVPLVVNPRFGQQIAPGFDLSRVRIGMRLSF
jgi:hypothetical protein